VGEDSVGFPCDRRLEHSVLVPELSLVEYLAARAAEKADEPPPGSVCCAFFSSSSSFARSFLPSHTEIEVSPVLDLAFEIFIMRKFSRA